MTPQLKNHAARLVRKNCDQFSPALVNSLMNLIGNYGPNSNCWGLTLFSLGAESRLKYIEDDVMQDWLQKNTRVVDQPVTGSILAISSASGNLEHTAIYLGQGLYLHQEGFTGPFLIHTLAKIMETYPGEAEFRAVVSEEIQLAG